MEELGMEKGELDQVSSLVLHVTYLIFLSENGLACFRYSPFPVNNIQRSQWWWVLWRVLMRKYIQKIGKKLPFLPLFSAPKEIPLQHLAPRRSLIMWLGWQNFALPHSSS
jgi:hypothetical protein